MHILFTIMLEEKGLIYMSLELDDIGGARELAIRRMEVAEENLSDAIANFEEGHLRTSNNRAYYAIFRAASACLALEFKSFKKHGQVLASFNKDFVHTGIFSKDIGRKISKAQEIRHASDYDDFYIVSTEEARQQLETAKEVVEVVKKYIMSLSQEINDI